MPPKTEPKTQNYLRGAASLSAAIVLTKIIGAFYKIPILNMLSEAGAAQYDAAFKLYATLFTLATAGLPVAISKMVSESVASGAKEERRIFQVAQRIFLFIGGVGAVGMFAGAPWIAAALNAPGAVWSIRIISPAVLLIGFICPFRGFFQGQGNMVPTGVSEVLESFGKLVFSLAAVFIVLNFVFPLPAAEQPTPPAASVADHSWDSHDLTASASADPVLQTKRDQWGAAAAISGVLFGMLLAAAYLRWKGRKFDLWEPRIPNGGRHRRLRDIAKQMLWFAFPVMLSSSTLSITNLIEAGMVRNLLVSGAGFSMDEMEKIVGSYSYASNLFGLPTAFVVTLGMSLLPAISSYLTQKRYSMIGKTVRSALRVTSLLALPAASGYIFLAAPILTLLYPGRVASGGVEIAAPLLSLLGFSVFFVCVVTVSTSILQGLGKIWVPICTMAIGCIVKIGCTLVFASHPAINIKAAPIGTIACYGLIFVLNLAVILAVTRQHKNFIVDTVKPLLAAAAMGFIALGTYNVLVRHFGNAVSVLGAIVVGGLSYFALLLILRGLAKEDVELLPGGRRIARVLQLR